MERTRKVVVVLEYKTEETGDLFVTVPHNLNGCIYEALTDALDGMTYSKKTANHRLGHLRFVDALDGIKKISQQVKEAGGECVVVLWNARCIEQEIEIAAEEFLNQYNATGQDLFRNIMKESAQKHIERRARLAAKRKKTTPSQP
ncbi:MAG: hypothetical protein RIQ54_666 [Candidatus Parcubacteria bacterium]|jgi:hypothetical protein